MSPDFYLNHSMYCCNETGFGGKPSKPGCAFPFGGARGVSTGKDNDAGAEGNE